MLFSNNFDQLKLICPKAAEFWASHDMATLENGSYDLGDGECVNVMAYTNMPRAQKEYEAHKAFLDIQCVIAGQELIEVAPTPELTETRAFDDANDYALYSNETAGEVFLMAPGRFIVVGPEDAHMPGVAVGEPEAVKKAVFKIKVQQ